MSTFEKFISSIESVYLVEASPTLREAQRQLLCGDAPFEKVGAGVQSTSKYSNIPITWCEDIRSVPKGEALLLGYYQFSYVDRRIKQNALSGRA